MNQNKVISATCGFDRELSLPKHLKNYVKHFILFIEKERKAQKLNSIQRNTYSAELIPINQDGLCVLILAKKLKDVDPYTCRITIESESGRFEASCEEELNSKIIPEISKELSVDEERILLISLQDPDETPCISEGDLSLPITLILYDDSFERQISRMEKNLEYVVNYLKIKFSSLVKSPDGISNGDKSSPFLIKWDLGLEKVNSQDQHIYNLLLEDHKIEVSEKTCFIELKKTKDGLENNKIKIELIDSKLKKSTFELNSNQLEGIQIVLKSPITVITGPPGTGKTHTASILTAILANLILNSLGIGTNKILICAQSNTGVNNLADKMTTYGLNVTKISGNQLLKDEKSLKPYDLSIKLKEKIKKFKAWRKFTSLQLIEMLKTILKDKSRKNLKDFDPLLQEELLRYYEEIIRDSHVICCTLAMIQSFLLSGIKFPFIIMDEASLAVEPEALTAFIKHPQKIIMFGDHKQLSPFVASKENSQNGLSLSLFARLNEIAHPDIGVHPDIGAHMLTMQYRMPSRLIQFSSHKFYNSQLKSNKPRASKELDWMFKEYNIKDKETSIALLDVFDGCESKEGVGIKNEREGKVLVSELKKIIKKGKITPDRIGVIAYYALQVQYIKDHLLLNGISEVEVDTVDGFQGKEKDIIMLSLVRSKPGAGFNFMNDHKRINVAVTRAKEWLFVFCNRKAIKSFPIWSSYLKCYSL